jgi:hypothetical protein
VIDKIAEALWEHERALRAAPTVPHAGLYEFRKRELREQARGLIEAMREPSEQMLAAGATELRRYDHRFDSELSQAESIYEAMIDATLQGGPA